METMKNIKQKNQHFDSLAFGLCRHICRPGFSQGYQTVTTSGMTGPRIYHSGR